MKRKDLSLNVKYQDEEILKEKMISVLLSKQPNEVGKILKKADLPLSMFEEMKI